MWLEQIILDGFKSYAQATTITPFDKSFTAITGLNGSGKSNIFDAICFVLGISQLSRIRVSNMTDLIYKQGQAGISKASVSLVFNNDNQAKSPQGYEQFKKLIITRQIFSNGTTKYLLNDQVTKQKTVKQLFQSTGMNINNPNFLIMQGRIQSILNMKPLELLSLLEETAGTLMYDQNKKDAEKTFDQKELRLNQIRKTINEEIKPKIEQLEKDRIVSVQISQLQKGIKGLEIVNNIFSLFQAIDEISQLMDQQQLNKETENTLRQDILQEEQLIQEKQIALNQIAVIEVDQTLVQQYDSGMNQIALVVQNLTERQNKIVELQKEQDNKQKQIKRIENQIDSQRKQLTKNQEQIGQFEQKIEALNQLKRQEIAIQQQVDLIKTGNVDSTYLEGIVDTSGDFYKQLQKKLFPKNESISLDEFQSRTEAWLIKEQNYLGQMQSDIQNIYETIKKLEEQKAALESGNVQYQNQIVMNIKKINMIINQIQQMQIPGITVNNITLNNNDFTSVGAQVEELMLQIKAFINSQKKDYKEVQFQIKKFSKQEEQYKQELLDQFQHNCNNKSGLQIMNMVNKAKGFQNNTYNIMGLVIDFLSVNTDALNMYAQQKGFHADQVLTAAQNFAISKFFNIVFQRVQDASRFINSQQCTVRCTALPLDNIQDSHVQQSRINKVHSYGGIMLTEIFKPTDTQLNSVFNQLFGQLVVCKDIQTAKQIAYDVECKFRCVTFDQDVVDPSGVVSGGVKKVGGDFVSCYCKLRDFDGTEQLQQLQQQEKALESSIAQVTTIQQNAQQLQQQVALQLEQLNNGGYQNICLLIKSKNDQLEQNQENIQSLSTFIQMYQQIIQYLNNNQQNNNQKQLNQQLQQLKKTIKQQQQEIDVFQNSAMFKNVQDIKLQLQVDNEEIQAINAKLKDVDGEIQNAINTIEELKTRKIQLEQQLQSTEQLIQQQSSNKRDQVEQQARIRKEIDQINKKLAQKRQKFNQLSTDNMDVVNQYHVKFNQAQDLLNSNAENLSIIQVLNEEYYQSLQQTFKLPKKGNQLGIKYLAQYLFDSGVVEPVQNSSNDALKQLIIDVFPRSSKMIQTLNHQLVELQQSNKNVVTSSANLEELQKSAKQLTQMEQKLLDDKEKIIGLITKVDERKSVALEELFESVNQNMGSIFGILLPGGYVRLDKVKENDISKGVQFNIKLGETNTTLSGLSGGQKSLLALSFTLALLRYKPSPIYILDEIDAALDLSHTHGIGRLIQQEFQDSQFIIISLKEGMFNHANQLFKIKFVDGISKVELIK